MNAAHTPALRAAQIGPFPASMAQRRPNRQGQVQVLMQAATLMQLTQIATWVSGWPALTERLAPLMPMPEATGLTAWQGGDWIARTGPQELWVMSAHASPLLQRIHAALSDDIGHSLDLSHARCRLRLQGAGAVPTLQKLFALDFRETAFPVGQVRLSGAHHLPAVLHRSAQEVFDLILHTTYAHDQVESVLDAALEWGVELNIDQAGTAP